MQKMHREQQIGRNTERNADRLKSMLLTLLCAIVILGVGYGVIVESGKKILEKEPFSVPLKCFKTLSVWSEDIFCVPKEMPC